MNTDDPTHRLIAVMHDSRVVTTDFSPQGREYDNPLIYWRSDSQTFRMADFVVSIDLRTGATEVLKNRWGVEGKVVR